MNLTNQQVIDQYNETCNRLKQKVQDHEISMEFLLTAIEETVDSYLQHFDQLPPAELPQNRNVNAAIPKFRKRTSGITTLQELGNLIIHLDEYLLAKYFENKLVQLEELEYNSLIEEVKQQNKGTTIDEIKELMKGYVDVGLVTEKKAERILKDLKTCEFYRCSNVFYVGKGGFDRRTKFCSNHCKVLHKVSLKRERETGSKLTQSELFGISERREERSWQENRVLSPNWKPHNDVETISFEQWMHYLGDLEVDHGTVGQKSLRKLREEMRIKEIEKLNENRPVKTYRIEDLNKGE
ncbi:hypothetical protein H1164_08330 [Thermoactinomyces daqus]|uniref:Uncharacterized protein n=1 Tax=Thermoactinomyces daqus TaxID=1329516 RepID=A0A7W2AH64_9BACL|nr:hypothetical protein [Thermoactinomyces daqus]MBA4542907.1 hypothetical protein [Thermoactinomyces daqus]